MKVKFEKARNFAPRHTVRTYQMDITEDRIALDLVKVEADEDLEDKRTAIEQALEEGMKQSKIAKLFDVSQPRVSQIKRKRER